MDENAIREDYQIEEEWLEGEVKHSLERHLRDTRRIFAREQPDVAPPKMPECRVKQFSAIVRKAQKRRPEWSARSLFGEGEEAKVEAIVNDLVGGRIVCGTASDVERVVAILAKNDAFRELRCETHAGGETGYRAKHIDACMRVSRDGRTLWFPVEIQVKTLLQDAWANFTHDEFYKSNEESPLISREISRHLADVLAGIDRIGECIRDERLRKKKGAKLSSEEEMLVTPRTLRILVSDKFKVGMSDVELRKSIDQLRAFGYESYAAVSGLVDDLAIRSMIAVEKIALGMSGDVSPYELLFFGPLAAKHGKSMVSNELRISYGFSDVRCESCEGYLRQDEKAFVEKNTDLDGVYLCKECSTKRMLKCETCDTLTLSRLCKNCASRQSEIL